VGVAMRVLASTRGFAALALWRKPGLIWTAPLVVSIFFALTQLLPGELNICHLLRAYTYNKSFKMDDPHSV
jgi:hypothetical protein